MPWGGWGAMEGVGAGAECWGMEWGGMGPGTEWPGVP